MLSPLSSPSSSRSTPIWINHFIFKKVHVQVHVIFLLLTFYSSQIQYSNANRHINFTTAAVCPTTTSPSNQSTLISGGLINLGNTCYLNSQLQCAYHIPKVRNIILDSTITSTNKSDNDSSSSSNSDNDEINNNTGLLSLQQLFKSMHTASLSNTNGRQHNDPTLTPSVSTTRFCQTLGINVYEQQDSQEFWKLLLPELNYNPLTKLYKGEYESYITALDGSGREKKRKEIFLDLSLDVTNFDNVNDSLEDMFTSGEVLSVKEGNGWRPEKGADKVDALKGCTITRSGLPHILQLHLMRFTYDMITGGMSKINDRFDFPLVSFCGYYDNYCFLQAALQVLHFKYQLFSSNLIFHLY